MIDVRMRETRLDRIGDAFSRWAVRTDVRCANIVESKPGIDIELGDMLRALARQLMVDRFHRTARRIAVGKRARDRLRSRTQFNAECASLPWRRRSCRKRKGNQANGNDWHHHRFV